MEEIIDQIKKPVVSSAIAVAFIVGVLFGLVVLGWWLMPVVWTDASPVDLQADYQADYMRMAVESFKITQDVAQAKARWNAIGTDKAATAMLLVKQNSGTFLTPDDIRRFEAAVQAPAVAIAPVTGEQPAVEQAQGGGLGNMLFILVLLMLGLTVLLGGIFAVMYLMRQRNTGPRTITPAMEANQAARQAHFTDFSTQDMGAPIQQFMASYKIGDDLFDDSFSIDSASGEFLGECGVGISDTIGVGDPKKVTGFEVWMFDKNDIQTITKVVMSRHAFNDTSIRNRLATKGEPVQAEPSAQIVLETATLRLTARIVDMTYGEGPLPPESYFDGLIIELAVWQKPA